MRVPFLRAGVLPEEWQEYMSSIERGPECVCEGRRGGGVKEHP